MVQAEQTIDLRTLSAEELDKEETKRAEFYDRFNMVEARSWNPVINELRFFHGYIYFKPFLIHAQKGDKFEISVRENEKRIHLAYIGVFEGEQQKGRGTEMMTILINLADKYGYSIDLDVVAKFGVGKRTLVKFYKKFGFVKGDYQDSYIRQANTIKEGC